MAKLVVLITSRIEAGHQIGEAWQQASAPGVTFIEGYGIRRLQNAARSAEVLPGMLSMFEILKENEETSLLILSLVETAELAQRLIQITEGILGSLLKPENGIAFIIPVESTAGVRDHGQD